MEIDLSLKIGKIKLKNPVMVSSGTFGYAEEYKDLVPIEKLGAVVTKSITLKPKEGNPPPRITETASGMLNAIGLENAGLDKFIKEKLPSLKKFKVPIIVSIAGDSLNDYVELAKSLDKEDIAGLELNISCPNVQSKEQLMFSQDSRMTGALVKAVREATDLTIITKLSPNVTDIKVLALEAEKAGSDAISLVNTFLAISIDTEKRIPKLANFTGGLSGPAIKPIALRMAYEVASCVSIPIVGQGGIMNVNDALEFLICGADAVSVGTASFIDPSISVKIIEGIRKYMQDKKIEKITELTDSLNLKKDY